MKEEKADLLKRREKRKAVSFLNFSTSRAGLHILPEPRFAPENQEAFPCF